jgi:Zn-dependent alcohol dehydrogenase
MATETPALVSYPADSTTMKPDWRFENIKLVASPKEHELKVRMVATGICHSDILVASIPSRPDVGLTYPKVLGHEGAGIVEEVGPGVTAAKVGDRVILSYNYCSNCDLCKADQQAYCVSMQLLNIFGEKGQFETKAGEDAPGKFFGQSSFAGTSIVAESSVVNLKGLVSSEDELKLLAPLGCGLMTGSGAVINGAGAKPHDIVLVTGLGAVGLGAIMAAKIAGCREIIALDRVAHRLETAKELGATKTLDTTTTGASFAEDIQKLVAGQRISVIVETTAAVPVINEALKALGKHGKFIQLGAPAYGTEITLPLQQFFTENKSFECHYLGNTTGQAWVPVMIKWWREGKFPVEKIVKHYPAKDAVQALHEMEDGTTIKPVLVW